MRILTTNKKSKLADLGQRVEIVGFCRVLCANTTQPTQSQIMAAPSLGIAHHPPFSFAHFDSLQKGQGTFCFDTVAFLLKIHRTLSAH